MYIKISILLIRQMQIKPQWNNPLVSVRIAIIKKQNKNKNKPQMTSVDQDMQKRCPFLYTVVGM